MDADLDALATRLYVTIDDLLNNHPGWRPERPTIGIAPRLSDSESITLAVIQAESIVSVITTSPPARPSPAR